MKLRYRVVAAVLLLSVLGGSFVHYEATEDRRWPYPDPDDLAADYDAHVGEEVFLFGEVTAVDPGGDSFTIEAEGDEATVSLTVADSDRTVQPSGTVQVYGTLEPDRTVAADRIETVNADTGALLYKYGASVLGVLLFLAAFVRYWTVDTDRWALEARRDG